MDRQQENVGNSQNSEINEQKDKITSEMETGLQGEKR